LLASGNSAPQIPGPLTPIAFGGLWLCPGLPMLKFLDRPMVVVVQQQQQQQQRLYW